MVYPEGNSYKESIDVGLGGAGQSALGSLAGSSEATKSSLVVTQVLAELALEFLHELSKTKRPVLRVFHEL
jgi:hypothetical protein